MSSLVPVWATLFWVLFVELMVIKSVVA